MIDRKKGPKVTTQFNLSLEGIKTSVLSNGMECFEIHAGSQEIIKVELVFKKGRIHEIQRATARAALSLIKDGSSSHSHEQLSHIYDYHGSIVKSSSHLEYSSVSLICQLKHFKHVWPVWHRMVWYPTYDAERLEKYKQLSLQKMKDNLSKNEVVAYREMTALIFGKDHPYGYNTEVEDIEKLKRAPILDYYNANMATCPSGVIISGNYNNESLELIKSDLSQIKRNDKQVEPQFYDWQAPKETILIQSENTQQVSIKIGTQLFDAHHPDYINMKVLDMIFGGYFGSRLMKNIREEKGYTYGIYSSTHCMNKAGYFYISAEVGQKYVEPTLEEIRKEIDILKSTLIEPKELDMVKNYIQGQSLHNLDGPFAKATLVKELYSKGLPLTTMESRLKKISNIQPEALLETANKYLNYEAFTKVLVGKV